MKWTVLASTIALAMIIGMLLMFSPEAEAQNDETKFRVAMILAGLRNDHSWNETHYEAIQKAEKLLNLEVAYYENVPTDSTAQSIMEQAIQNGAKTIIANSFGFGGTNASLVMRKVD